MVPHGPRRRSARGGSRSGEDSSRRSGAEDGRCRANRRRPRTGVRASGSRRRRRRRARRADPRGKPLVPASARRAPGDAAAGRRRRARPCAAQAEAGSRPPPQPDDGRAWRTGDRAGSPGPGPGQRARRPGRGLRGRRAGAAARRPARGCLRADGRRGPARGRRPRPHDRCERRRPAAAAGRPRGPLFGVGPARPRSRSCSPSVAWCRRRTTRSRCGRWARYPERPWSWPATDRCSGTCAAWPRPTGWPDASSSRASAPMPGR